MIYRLNEFLLLVPFLCSLVTCHEAVNPIIGDQGHHHHHVDQPPEAHEKIVLHDAPSISVNFDSSVHNKEHIHEHLDGYAKRPEDMSDEELQFHYFKLHDYNDDNELDGLEFLQAFLHDQKEGENKGRPLDFDFIVKNVDYLLEQYDRNKDGKVSYPEFISSLKSQMSDSSASALTTQSPVPAQEDLK